MRHKLYDVLMGLAVILLNAFVKKGKLGRRIEGLRRQDVAPTPPGTTCCWIHCASVGEYEQAKPLIALLRAHDSSVRIVVTFFSASGYEWSQQEEHDLDVCYLPWDTTSAMKDLIGRLRPSVLVIVKYELWSNMIRLASERGAHLLLVSARCYEGQPMLTWARSWYHPLLQMIDHIFVQDTRSKDMLAGIGVTAIVSGDTRADRVLARKVHAQADLAEAFSSERLRPLLVIGSLWPEDWACFEPVIDEVVSTYDIIIAPHEIHEDAIADMMAVLPTMVRWTRTDIEVWAKAPIALLDTMGQLAEIYRYADVAYVGGAFKQGLHNIFEPAVFGCPVIFGPQTWGYAEADDLIDVGGAFSVSAPQELSKQLMQLSQRDSREAAGQAALDYVVSVSGSTERIFHTLRELLG